MKTLLAFALATNVTVSVARDWTSTPSPFGIGSCHANNWSAQANARLMPQMTALRFQCEAILPLLTALLLLTGCDSIPMASGPMPHEAYVWQRLWTPAVAASLDQAGSTVQAFVPLAAEVSLTGGKVKVISPNIDFAALKKADQAIGLAIRIAPQSGLTSADHPLASEVIRLARERIAEAGRHGVTPLELQIDYDCAERKLAGYRAWLQAVRAALAPLPVRPTVLPAWLRQREFKMLARESGGYILQVHSTGPPKLINGAAKLTDPEQARAWVEQAGRLGVPFRVALPTYTYLVAFDPAAKVLGITAEGPSARWPPEAQVVRWEADPLEIAALVEGWTRTRPATMAGIIWYRLPVAGDALNWRWPTLTAVMQGRAPESRLIVQAGTGQPGDVVLINEGERDEPLPEWVEASWTGAQLVASDALAGYELDHSPEGTVRWHRVAPAHSRLPPGGRHPIGWIRCEPAALLRTLSSAHAGSASDRNGNGPGNRVQ